MRAASPCPGESLPCHGRRADLRCLRGFRRARIHTAIETCGCFDPSLLPALVRAADLFLWDIKDTDDARHRLYTGVSNESIIGASDARTRWGPKRFCDASC